MIKEYGACIDLDEVSQEAAPRMMDRIKRGLKYTLDRKLCDLPTRDYGFAFAHSPEGHLVYICSLAYGDTILLPSLAERIASRGYTDIFPLNSATILNMIRKGIDEKN